jgi:Na+-translocating ferredoxin:NAD+ oxidoreductase RnfG subunit
MNIEILKPVFTGVMILLITISTGCSPVDSDSQARRLEAVLSVRPIMREIELDEQTGEQTRLFLLESSNEIIGYYVEKQVVSRSGPFEIGVVLNTEYQVLEAMVLNYPYQRGRQVCSEKFTKQFRGKNINDPLVPGTDINAMTGATISCRVMTEGVRSAIVISRKMFQINHSI